MCLKHLTVMTSPFFIRNFKICNFKQIAHIHRSSFNLEQKFLMTSFQKFLPEVLESKIQFWMKKYEDLFGITKLSELHAKILKMKEEIQVIQDKRRKVQEDIFITQKKLQESHDVLHKVSIGDDMYITLVTQVRDLLKEQKQLQEAFSLYDKTEREFQTNLFMAINSSQDHEKTSREKHKYVSVIIGFIGGLLGLLASSIHNYRHRKGVRNSVSDITKDIQLHTITLTNSVKSITEGLTNQMENLKIEFLSKQDVLESTIKDIELMLGEKVTNGEIDDVYSDLHIKQILFNMDENINSKLKMHSYVNAGLFSTLIIICSLLFYLNNSN